MAARSLTAFAVAGGLIGVVISLAVTRVGGVLAVGASVALVGVVLGGACGYIVMSHRESRRHARRSAKALARVNKSVKSLRAEVRKSRTGRSNGGGSQSDMRRDIRLQGALSGLGEQIVNDVRHSGHWDFRQLEALINLHSLMDVRGAIPMSRGFAASPDIMLTYVTHILRVRPSLIVECGSGLSSVWAGYAADICGPGTRVVALEDQETYALATREMVRDHGLENVVEVRHAPLRTLSVGSDERRWYDPAALEDLHGIGVLFVDGPDGSIEPQARYPAVPVLRTKLAPGAVVLVDDADRRDEADMVERWRAEWRELDAVRVPHEKGAILLRVPT